MAYQQRHGGMASSVAAASARISGILRIKCKQHGASETLYARRRCTVLRSTYIGCTA